jgi:imidazolonepropionase-like amidohydrolase
MKPLLYCVLLLLVTNLFAQKTDTVYLLKPARVFDGETMHEGWQVVVKGNSIEAVGDAKSVTVPANATIVDLKNKTLLPGLIEGHSHLFLHPYNETPWEDQVLKESRAERTARAVNGARATLLAGFTTVRDLGTEGALYDDVGLKKAIEKGVIWGPRMIVATRAIVAKGTYAPKSENADIDLPQGAAEVGGLENMMAEVRTQIAKGADVIKLYADYRWGKNGEALPTFSIEEMALAVNLARNGGRQVVAHAASPEGMRRATLAGVATIEHGDEGTAEVFQLMKQKGVALCPTLSAGEAVLQYEGWRKGVDTDPKRIVKKRKSFTAALKSGVIICMGGDVGVYAHGDNAREMERMVDYDMQPLAVLKSATSVNADVFGYNDRIGRIKKGLLADLIAVEGNPARNMPDIRKVVFVMKDGVIYKK